MIEVDEDTFEDLVGDALDGIPDELARLMSNVAVIVEDGWAESGLLGLYRGVPLTKRDAGYGLGVTMPDRITIYRLPICARCSTHDEVVEQVRITVVHEIAHHFGIDDHRLTELGIRLTRSRVAHGGTPVSRSGDTLPRCRFPGSC